MRRLLLTVLGIVCVVGFASGQATAPKADQAELVKSRSNGSISSKSAWTSSRLSKVAPPVGANGMRRHRRPPQPVLPPRITNMPNHADSLNCETMLGGDQRQVNQAASSADHTRLIGRNNAIECLEMNASSPYESAAYVQPPCCITVFQGALRFMDR